MVAADHAAMHSQVMHITPEQAVRWLDGNVRNRPLDQAYVDRLVGEMKAGLWKLLHQGIAFDPHGVLLDGQHRLWAIALSGVTVPMHVTFNAPSDCLEYLDGGKVRTAADRMSLSNKLGDVRPIELAVLRAMVRGLSANRRMAFSREMDLLARHRVPVDFAIDHLATSRIKGVSGSITCAVVARAWYCAKDLDRLKRFCEVLRTGLTHAQDESTIILLRDYLGTRDRSDSLTNLREQYGKVERALVAFLNGQKLSMIRPCQLEMFPLPEEESQQK